MAEDKDQDYIIDGVSFEEDPLKFCQQIYDIGQGRCDDLAEQNEENRLFYEGIDKRLDDRKNDPLVKRSAIYVHELTPAVDTRVGDSEAKIEEQRIPVTYRPKSQNPSREEKDRALWIESTINQQLRDCRYLCEVYHEHALAAEIQRSPSFVKVGWQVEQKDVPEIQNLIQKHGLYGAFGALLRGEPLKSVVWKKEEVGGPMVEWMHPEDVLYQPHVSDFYKSDWCVHVMWMEYHKLVALANEQGYDLKKIHRLKDELSSVAPSEDSTDSQRDSLEDEKDSSYRFGYRDGKYLVCENYIVHYDEAGDEEIRQVVTVGNKEIVKNDVSPYKGIRFPFVPLVINRLPGTIEGMSSVDRGKHLQRLNNELHNSFIDWMTYGLFPPYLVPNGMSFGKKPKFGPMELWYVDDPEAIKPLLQTGGRAPVVPEMLQSIAAKIRQVVNAPDISQNFQSNPYEKATSTKARMMGSERRSVPANKAYGQAVIRVAEMILSMDQQYHPEAEKFVLDGTFDVPSLTAMTDPETEKQELMLLLAQILQNPIYQNPVGQAKIRNLMQEMFTKFLKRDVTDYVPTEQEMAQILGAQAALMQAQVNKQNAIEQMQMVGQAAPPEMEQAE